MSEKRKLWGVSRGGWVFILLCTPILAVVDSEIRKDSESATSETNQVVQKIPMDDSVYRYEINKFVTQYCILAMAATLTSTGKPGGVDGETYRLVAAETKELNIKTAENLLPIVRGKSDGYREHTYHTYQRMCDQVSAR